MNVKVPVPPSAACRSAPRPFPAALTSGRWELDTHLNRTEDSMDPYLSFHLKEYTMAKSTTNPQIIKFYQSAAWKRCQRHIKSKYRGLCQNCGCAGWEVHHKIPLTIYNLNDPEITMGEDNLTLLCTACHNAERNKNYYVRAGLEFDEEGNLRQSCPPSP